MSRLGARRPHNILGPDLAWVMGILCVCTAARAQPAGQPQPAQPARVQPQAAPPAAAPAAPAAAAEAAGQDATSTENLTLRDAPELKDPLTVALTPKSGGLTADEVARRAVVASDSLAAKRAAIEAAAAKVDEAVARFLPRLTLKAGYTRLSRVENSLSTGGGGLVGGNGTLLEVGPCPPGYTPTAAGATGCVQNAAIIDLQFPVLVNNYSLSANLGVPFSDYLLRLSSSIATTKHEKRAAELSASAEKRKIAADARVAFYNWARGIGQLTVSQNSLGRVQARLKDSRVAFELGAATKADVLRLEAMVAATQAAIEAARAFRALTAEQLATVMNDNRTNYDLGESVTAPIEPLPNNTTLDQYIAQAYRQRLELEALGESSLALRESAKVMRRGELPRLDGFAQYDYANPNSRVFPSTDEWRGTWMAGLSLSWVVNDVFSNGAVAKQLDAQRVGLEAQARALKDGVRMEVVSAYLEGQKARAALEAAKRGTDAALAAYNVATELYRVGRATTTEVIDAESELVAAQLQLVNVYIDERVARTKLAYATGSDITRVR